MKKQARLTLIRKRAEILRAAGKLGPRPGLRDRDQDDDGTYEPLETGPDPRGFRDDEHDDSEW